MFCVEVSVLFRYEGRGFKVKCHLLSLLPNCQLGFSHWALRLLQSYCSLAGGNCGLGINRKQWLLRRKFSGSHFSSSWYIWAPSGSLSWVTYASTSTTVGFSPCPAPHSSPRRHPVPSWLPHASQGLGTKELSQVPAKSRSQEDLGLGDEKAGDGEEMKLMSGLLCLHRWRCHFYSVAIALVSTGA